MKSLLTVAVMAMSVFGLAATPAQAEAVVGEAAPAFSAQDVEGNAVSLEELKGNIVVLEWTNDGCPFVQKHYDSGNMQELQEEATADGVVWITVNSGAPGKQGHLDAEGAKALMDEKNSHASHYIIDEEGVIGKSYGAKVTPHMFVIDEQGVLVYNGAIDSNDSANPATIEGATNYVAEALEALEAGEEIEVAESKPYGCGVKY